jgi:hypothetical protein
MPDNVEANGAEVSDAMSENEHEYDESDHLIKEDEDESMAEQHTSPEPGVSGEVKKKYDPKDPHRPRRKKARRACYACQRAHLTCGKSIPLGGMGMPLHAVVSYYRDAFLGRPSRTDIS